MATAADGDIGEGADLVVKDAAGRPPQMGMAIQSGILKSLGINLYTNLGKVLVEFIANAYDSDASTVWVTVPDVLIQQERTRAKAKADEEAARVVGVAPLLDIAEGRTPANDVDAAGQPALLNLEALFRTLPEDIDVVIEDDGHGMTWLEVEKKFLPLNRQRRLNKEVGKEINLTSEGGRYVMGRKGVGKLAGFGAALTVKLWTKRKGETYATVIELVDEDLNQAASIAEVRIPVTYEDGLHPDMQGTKVTLSRLKADATRDSLEKIKKAITKSFSAIRPEDFVIEVNGEPLKFEVPDYEFIFPTHLTREGIARGERQKASVHVPGIGDLPFSYYVGFLARSHGSGADRGATIYCNNRLAAGPALFGLPTGMHSFHSTDYMDCIVEADALDRSDIDFVNTARNGIKEGNEVVGAMLEAIVRVMRGAINEHSRFKRAEADRKLLEDKTASVISRTIETLPAKTRKAGKRLLQTIAQQYEVGTPEFEEIAPAIIHSINATEVLITLASKGTDAETIAQIMGQLRQLSEIEKRDSIKLYRARRGGIEKLEMLYEKGKEDWKRKQSEKALHQLFKENPWLIRPEFSTYISSDQGINTTVTRLAEHLKVDRFAPIMNGDDEADVRPDLVFLMSDPMEEGPYTVKVVELKSPGLPLTIDHWRQLENYVADVRFWCEGNVPHDVRVNGYLIGAMPEPSPTKNPERMLLEEFKRAGPTSSIQIIGLLELIKHARTVHVEAIKALERDLAGEDEDEEDVEETAEIVDPEDEAWRDDLTPAPADPSGG
ncbi:ATP-binding protein [Sphingomonas adhaesiva]|uniref:ATP-binding protein n=1 Tax=Sphingomonas adhaesiva TaxID=28212 RepID=A0A2A4ID43_9SPHN|nr:ATP-binding protein [Sphingomonas adhaesiva]PCG15740.1 hypothetical protein COA07_01795 [Sphingomonas adhaesiva]